MPPAHRADFSHRACYLPNFIARSTAHGGGGRLRIQFDQPDFIAWRSIWGNTVFFKRLEYRKLRVSVKHEFILLRGLSKRSGPIVPQNSLSGAGSPSAPHSDTPNPDWWTTIPDEVSESVLKFEREACPDAQINAFVATEAYDFVEFADFIDLNSKERDSTIELAIEFPHPVDVEEVVAISSSISEHQHAQLYTLRQFNCFFYSWTIITILLRLHIDWSSALQSDVDRTTELLTTRLVELSDPQRARPDSRRNRAKLSSETRPNLCLLIAGEYDCAEILDTSQRPFVRLCQNTIRESSTFQRLLSSLNDPRRQPPLWVRDDLSIVRDHIRNLLNGVADLTTGLAVKGTGEKTISDLFWSDSHIRLLPGWESPISRQSNGLLEIYVDRMWDAFNDALKQTNEAHREKVLQRSDTHNRRSNALQRMGNSPLVLGTRLTPMGLRAAWNAAQLRASLNPSNSPLMPLIRTIEAINDVPNQLRHVSKIASDFLAILATKRDQARDEIHQRRAGGESHSANTTSNLSLNLGRSTVLGMMNDIDFRKPEFDAQIICELEKAVKGLGLARPNCSMHDLRMATLELLIRLKEKGRSVDFGLPLDSVWRICVWYSLGEEIVNVLETAAEPGPTERIQCWLRASKEETRGEARPILVSEIQTFIRGRIMALSRMIHNAGGPGAASYCQKEIEEAMDTIWKDMLKKGTRVRQSGLVRSTGSA